MRGSHRSGKLAALMLTVGAAVLLCAPQILAGGRDSDASRMQARKIDVGASESDSLNPPKDRVDWRYFKLGERRSVEVSVSGADESASMTVELTTATGTEIDSTSATRGNATLEKTLDPGIYYFSVSAKRSTTYSVQVR